MTEKPALGVQGFLIYDFSADKHVFRVYGEKDQETGQKPFKDYELCAESIKITINEPVVSLFEEGNLNWATSYTGKKKD